MIHEARFRRDPYDGDPVLDSGLIPCTIESSPDRAIGLASGGGAGGDLTITLKRADYLALASSVGLPLRGETVVSVSFGLEGDDPIVLGGYFVRHVAPQMYGVDLDDDAPEPEPRFNAYTLTLTPLPQRWADGRGGYLWADTLNPIGPGGLPPADGDPNRVENSALVELLGTYLPLPLVTPLPTTLDEFEPPAPLDWGAGRALPELEALLARVGHAACMNNAGTSIKVFRLSRAGEDLALPDPLPAGAEPYELAESPGLRAERLVVTSGRTRITLLTTRDLADDFEWVWFDDRTGRWLNDADTLALYPTETQPGDIDALREGPGANGRPPEEFNRIMRCARLKDDAAVGVGALVAVGAGVEVGVPGAPGDVLELGSSPAAAFGEFAQPSGGGAGQFVKREDAAVRGLKVDGVNRVIVFPYPFANAPEPNPDPELRKAPTLADLLPFETGDVTVVFAHERNTDEDVPFDNYFMASFRATFPGGGAPMAVTLEDNTELLLALLNPDTLYVDAPFIRLVGTDVPPPGEPGPITWLNLPEVLTTAFSIARARLAGPTAKTGIITFAGLRDFAPGDWEGAITRVSWNLSQVSTTVEINQHDIPLAAIDQSEAQAGRSLAAGLSRFTLPGSSSALSDARLSTTPGAGAGAGPGASLAGSSGGLDPAGASGARGAGATAAAPPVLGAPTPEDVRFEPGVFLAKITGNELITTGRWKYTWIEASITAAGGFADAAAGGRRSATHGHALNLAEGMNDGMGIEGNGVDRANLPGTFAMQPIPTGRHVFMRGPFGAPGAPLAERWCAFDMSNADDGECEVGS
jgi:hypothetical protein